MAGKEGAEVDEGVAEGAGGDVEGLGGCYGEGAECEVWWELEGWEAHVCWWWLKCVCAFGGRVGHGKAGFRVELGV